MVRNASRALKIGVHLPFGLNFDVANRTFYPEKFRLAYCICNTYYILCIQYTYIYPIYNSNIHTIITFECEPDAVPLKHILDMARICTYL